MATRPVVILGSVNMDLVVRCAHLPRPGETVTGHDFRTVPGGKGANQAVAAARLGANVKFVGCVGTDAFQYPAYPAHAVDTADAGDAFVGALAAACAAGDDLTAAADFAQRAAAIRVERHGAQAAMPRRDQLPPSRARQAGTP